MGFEIRKKKKHTKMKEFVKEIKKIYEKTKITLIKLQKEVKKYIDKNRKEVVEYNIGDKMLLSMKDLIWQIRNRKIKKLIEKFMRLYKIKKIILENVVELELLALSNS